MDKTKKIRKFKKVYLPESYNYVAVFLTAKCSFNCQWCVNEFSKEKRLNEKSLSGRDWVKGLNRISAVNSLPVTLQGGEPSLHPDFIWIINNLKKDLDIDILTNLNFNIDEFIARVNPGRLKRKAPYASIRVSYHPGKISLDQLIFKVKRLQDKGFSIGIYGILHPLFRKEILKAQTKCRKLGLDFRTKEFLGVFKGKVYGTYRYPEAVQKKSKTKVACRTSELLICPEGKVYRCHYDLYRYFNPLGSILDPGFSITDEFRECSVYGYCHYCDIKVKTNRFQEFGHSSVEIKFD
jgi:MoaA/NifB/PqqE/SkfB family radical SAM enzyme